MEHDPPPAPPPDSTGKWTYEAAQLHLARLSLAGAVPLRQMLRDVTDLAAAALRVSRVSIWLFLDERRAIRCDFLHQPASRAVYEGTILNARDFPSYFRALSLRRVISVLSDDEDPLTAEFRDAYFRPLGITAMLDAPIYQAGQMVGIVCHEHIGPARMWTGMDREFAACVADTIARLYEEDRRTRAESTVRLYQEQAAELQRVGSVGLLAAGVAHDFRNMIGVISGFADLIAEATAGDDRVAGLVREVHAVVDRAVRLTEELKQLGHRDQTRPTIVDVGVLLERSLPLLQTTVGPKIRLEVQIAPRVSRVFIDSLELERVILNLVVNARDAMPTGGEIRITLREAAHADSVSPTRMYVLLAVEDTGVGMDDATRSRIFDPFFTTKGGAGTGLGLAIVQQIVTAAGGFVEVTSAPGQGTRLSLYLPRIAAPA